MRVGGNGGEIFVADLKVQIISFDAERGDARSRSRDGVGLFRGATERSRKRDRTDLGRDLSAHFTFRKVRRVNVHPRSWDHVYSLCNLRVEAAGASDYRAPDYRVTAPPIDNTVGRSPRLSYIH